MIHVDVAKMTRWQSSDSHVRRNGVSLEGAPGLLFHFATIVCSQPSFCIMPQLLSLPKMDVIGSAHDSRVPVLPRAHLHS